MNTRVIVSVVAVALIVLGIWYFAGGRADGTPGTNIPTTTPGGLSATQRYASTTQGVSFRYPDRYVLEERDEGVGTSRSHVITLIDRKDLPPPQDGEGPPAITVQVFPVTGQSLRSWIEGAQASNFQLSPDDKLTTTTVSGVEALRYRWSGLYEGESIALLRGGRVYVFSVSWMSESDRIRDDFDDIVDSIEFAWD